MSTDKKHALITGANKGIGFAIAKGLAERGMTVWIGARVPERGEAAVAQLTKDGLDARFLAIDVADDASVRKAVTRLSDETDDLQVLVNNAGILVDVSSPLRFRWRTSSRHSR